MASAKNPHFHCERGPTELARIGTDSDGTSDFGGTIDEVCIYSRALSGTEVSAIHRAGSVGRKN